MRWATAIVVGLLAVRTTRADLPPGLPGVEWGYPLHVIETDQKWPDYVFVVCVGTPGTAQGFEAWFVEPSGIQPIAIRVVGPAEYKLLFVPRTDAERNKSADELVKAVYRDEIPQAALTRFEARIRVPIWDAGRIVVTHRLTRSADDKPEVSQTNWKHPLRELNLVAGFLTAALLLGGIWLIRRNRRRAAALTK